jgi:hypothetical protein
MAAARAGLRFSPYRTRDRINLRFLNETLRLDSERRSVFSSQDETE